VIDVLSLAGVDTRRVASRITSRTLIGRDRELGALTAVSAAAREGSARIALVAGDAGIGKTRLVRSPTSRPNTVSCCYPSRAAGW
jgi:Cdc6-like AAA superfamily ATPase